MAGLKTLLDGLAGEAPPYDVLDRAERAIRLRRRIVRLAPVAAGLAVVLVLGAGWAMLQDADPRPVVRPGTPATWLPSHLTVVEDPPPLPTDRGIGPAALLYLPSRDDVAAGAWRIVTSDGRQYGIAASMDEPRSQFLARASLSPDGRWLVVHRRDHLVLRDLTSTTERTVPLDHREVHAFWSVDSRKLVLVGTYLPGDENVTVVDLMSGAQSTASSLAAFGNPQPLGVDLAGDLVLKSGLPGPVIFWFVDPMTGREQRRLTFDGQGSASPGQIDQSIFNASSVFDGKSLLVTRDPSHPGDVVVVDFTTGKVTERHALPDQPAGPGTPGSTPGWRDMVWASQEAVLFVRRGLPTGGPFTDPAQPPRGPFTTAVEQLDRKTGTFSVVTSITGGIELLEPRGVGLR